MQKVNTQHPKNKGPSTLQKLLEERNFLRALKKTEADGIKKSVQLVWDTHNKAFDKGFAEINLKIAGEQQKGIKKKMNQHLKR